MNEDINLNDFYLKFITICDEILPKLSYAEQVIYTQLFGRTFAEGKDEISISVTDLAALTRLTVLTVRKALNSLEKHGAIKKVGNHQPKKPQTYKMLWPVLIEETKIRKRQPAILIIKQAKVKYPNIIDRLDNEDRQALMFLKEAIKGTDEEILLKQKAMETLKEGENIEDRYLELIVLTKFGPQKLAKYAEK